jgi:hypothetical protein
MNHQARPQNVIYASIQLYMTFPPNEKNKPFVPSQPQTNKQTMQSKTELRMREDKKAENAGIICKQHKEQTVTRIRRSNQSCFFELFPCPARKRA